MADTNPTNQATAAVAQNVPRPPPNPHDAILRWQHQRSNEWKTAQIEARRRDPTYVIQRLPESYAMPTPEVRQAAEEAYQEPARERRALREQQTAEGNPPSREQELQDMLESIIVLSPEQRAESYRLPAEKLDELLREWKSGILKVHAMPVWQDEPARPGAPPQRIVLEQEAGTMTLQEVYQKALEGRRSQRKTLTYGRDLPLPQVPREYPFTVELGGVPDESRVKLGPDDYPTFAEAVERRAKMFKSPGLRHGSRVVPGTNPFSAIRIDSDHSGLRLGLRPESPPSIDPRLLGQGGGASGSGM